MRFVKYVNPALKIEDSERGKEYAHQSRLSGNVWRYMSLERFVDLVNDSALYFAKASAFTDQHEFSVPESSVSALGFLRYASLLRKADEWKHKTYVNCWIKKTDESYLMWKSYIGNPVYGVAIKSKIHRLRKVIENSFELIPVEDKVHYGLVAYKNRFDSNLFPRLKTDGIENVLTLATTKREYYSEEKELRLVFLTDESAAENGIKVKVDLGELIDKIYLCPFAREEITSALKDGLASRYEFLAEKFAASDIKDR